MEMPVSSAKASIMGAQEPVASKEIWIYSVLLFIAFLIIMTLAKYIFSFGHFCLCDQASTERIGLNSITIEYILASSEILLMGC